MIEATHSDGDGKILFRINGEQFVNLDLGDALILLAELSKAIALEAAPAGQADRVWKKLKKV